MEFTTDIFKQFDKKWALLTAGNEDKFNTMTISWGGLGTIWNKPAATVYVRQSRYTHEFMDDNDLFTVSFYPEEYKDVLGVLGSRSGRDMDKMTGSGLNAVKAGGSMSFKEAEVTLVCRKLFKQCLMKENMPKDVADTLYASNDLHDMYIGEVVEIIWK
ncbi:MAG: flavin reductase [Lachnospiraceae bacterium]|nr:flavin reductase [Lachnospiraceae bacterium]